MGTAKRRGRAPNARAHRPRQGLDVRATEHLIVAGRADPQQPSALQSEQYALSVRACCALARVFLESGYDVAVDDVLEPPAFERCWRPLLGGLDWQPVIVLPSLEEVLRRSRLRAKRGLEAHSRSQHAACAAWPAEHRVDTTGLSLDQSLALVRAALDT